MGTRRQSRECALQMLYQLDVSGGVPKEVVENFWTMNEVEMESRAYANSLVLGVLGRLNEIDPMLTEHSTNWKISRMASVDKNILRIAIYELLHCDDVPAKVAINEAVEIAKRFGTADSGAFVNGILDNIAKEVCEL